MCFVCDVQFEEVQKNNWVYVPHDCYHHLYSKNDFYGCSVKSGVNWIHAMGDSQEREVVSVIKMLNGSLTSTTKYIAVGCVCFGELHTTRG